MKQSARIGGKAIRPRFFLLLFLVAFMLVGLVSCSKPHTATGVTAVHLPKTAVSLSVGGTYAIYPLADPPTVNTTFTYESDNTAVATVDANGLVKAVAPGKAAVKVTGGGKSADCTVTVTSQSGGSSSTASSASVAVSNPAWTNTKVPILMYHSISVVSGNNLCVPPDLFDSEMNWLHTNGYTTLSMDELYAHMNAHTALPDKTAVITLDDGYFDNYSNAYPILKKYGLKATVFVISGKIGTSNYLVESQLKEMSQNGIDIEDHTVTHGYLSKMTYDQQVSELQDSKKALEQITGKSVDYVAYPYGDYDANTLRAATAIGYKLGFLEDGGTAKVTDPVLEVPRSYVSAKNTLNDFIQIVQSK